MSGDDILERLRGALRASGRGLRSGGGDVASRNWKPFLIRVGALVTAMLTIAGVLYLSWMLAGPVATILYVVLFLMCLSAAPLAISLMGAAMPGSGSLGRGHIILGAFAFGHHYLVDRGTRWEWCPGNENQVFIDEEWHEIGGGFEHKSVLGWRPFGILRYKGDETLQNVRVDTKALQDQGREASADGGTVERGGFVEARRPAVSGIDGTWLVDLKRVFSRGVRQIGDIEIIETAEEIIERGQVNDSRVGIDNPTVTFLAALVFGVITGFLYVYLFGM